MLLVLRTKKIYFIIFFSLFYSPFILAEKPLLKIITSEWAPYTSEQLASGGFLSEIATTALKKAGYSVTLEFLPWKRALKLIKIGNADVLIGANYTKERTQYFSYPNYFWKNTGVFFVRKNHQFHHYQKTKDLCFNKLGIYAGSHYIKKFEKLKCFDIQPVATIEQNIKKLLNNRIDIFIDSKESVLFYLNKAFPNQKNEIVALSPNFITSPTYIIFSKKLKNHQKIQADFDLMIKRMQADGTYSNILKKHGIIEN